MGHNFKEEENSMKKLCLLGICLVFLFWLRLESPSVVDAQNQGRIYYVSPQGASSGNGSLNSPWDLRTALNYPYEVRPGDYIYLLSGRYSGNFESALSGVKGYPITIQSAPGHWAILDGNFQDYLRDSMQPAKKDDLTSCILKNTNLQIGSVLIVDNEELMLHTYRAQIPYCIRGRRTTLPAGHSAGSKVNTFGPVLRVRGQYVIVRDLEITNSNPQRSLPYSYNNWDPVVNSLNSERPTGLLIEAKESNFVNLVIHNNGIGVGFYSGAVNSTLYGCIIYHNGYIEPSRAHGHGLYLQNDVGMKNIINNVIFGNFYYGIQAYVSETSVLRGFFLNNNFLFHDSHFGGGGDGLIHSSDFSDNYFYDAYWEKITQCFSFASDCNVKNNYWYNGGNTYTVGNTVRSAPEVICQKNDFEKGRAHLAVINPGNLNQVLINPNCGGVMPGQTIEILDTQNLKGTPVYVGKYLGNQVTLNLPGEYNLLEPITGFESGIVYPNGMKEAHHLPSGKHTRSNFNVFLMRVKDSSAGSGGSVPTPTPAVPNSTPAPSGGNSSFINYFRMEYANREVVPLVNGKFFIKPNELITLACQVSSTVDSLTINNGQASRNCELWLKPAELGSTVYTLTVFQGGIFKESKTIALEVAIGTVTPKPNASPTPAPVTTPSNDELGFTASKVAGQSYWRLDWRGNGEMCKLQVGSGEFGQASPRGPVFVAPFTTTAYTLKCGSVQESVLVIK